MKSSFGITVLLLALCLSCNKNQCSKVQCGNNEICISGSCACNDGYEGQACDVLSAPKYIGNYYALETCTSGGLGTSYNPYIQQPSSSASLLIIGNFLNLYDITAYIRGDAAKTGNNIEIPQQQLGGSGSVYGQGVYNPATKRITINFEYTLNFQNKACTHTYYRQ